MTSRPPLLAATSQLRITTTSDWHVGAGHGVVGDLDALVRRDHDQLPYVPGTTLTGLLRDTGRIVAGALDGGAAEDPGSVGTGWPSAPHPAIRPAARMSRAPSPPPCSPSAPRGSPARCASASAPTSTSERRRRRADPACGSIPAPDARATSNSAWSRSRGGLPLAAELSLDPLPSDPDHLTALSALIVLAAQWCQQLGGGRRRGLGEVVMRVGEHRPEAWAGWLAETGWAPPDPPEPPPPIGDPAPASTGSTVSSAWSVLEIEVTTEGQVRVPRQVTGNLVRGSDHLPGSLLLPWLSQRWGAGIVLDAVWSGSLVVRAALPEVMDRRGIPAPSPSTAPAKVTAGTCSSASRRPAASRSAAPTRCPLRCRRACHSAHRHSPGPATTRSTRRFSGPGQRPGSTSSR